MSSVVHVQIICPTVVHVQIICPAMVYVQIIYMSSGGLCPGKICPAVVHVQIIYVQWCWDGFNLLLYMFISEILVNLCLLNIKILIE